MEQKKLVKLLKEINLAKEKIGVREKKKTPIILNPEINTISQSR